MNRREFISASGATLLSTAIWPGRILGQESRRAASPDISWHWHEDSNLFDRVAVDGRPLMNPEEGVGLLDGFCRWIENGQLGPEVLLGCDKPKGQCGPAQVSLAHRLLRSTGGAEADLLEATLTLRTVSEQPCEVLCGFLTGVRPCRNAADQQMYLPICTRGMTNKPAQKHLDCHQAVGSEGYLAHYFEPEASDPREMKTRAALLAPVVDVFADGGPCRVALFGSSVEPVFFQALEGPSSRAWRMGRRVRLEPGRSVDLKGYLLLHGGDASVAWAAFHRFAHKEDFPPPEWTRQFRVNYYDFLSAAEADGPRGGGYDLDLKHFGEFHVGMATQHGYYVSYGDFIHPDRKQWQAMPTDPKGPVTMSLEKMKARVEATRRAGVHPMIYMHFAILDEGSPLFEKLKDAVRVDADGKPVPYGWKGPDVIKQTWRMSTAAPAWRANLVQQAQWIMELLNPDGIVLDETFHAWGYDHHPDRRGPLSPGGIELMRQLRTVVRSFGSDKALFASDCSMGSYCLWGDGEAGDHCYDRLLGHPLYRQRPVRYLAALGTKAWQPCAWFYKTLWSAQMDLARATGAGVGVTNGIGDNFGLARLPEEAKRQMLRDIESLLKE
jgi:hypothetical protein